MDTITADNRNWFQKLLDSVRNSSTASQLSAARNVTNTPPDPASQPYVPGVTYGPSAQYPQQVTGAPTTSRVPYGPNLPAGGVQMQTSPSSAPAPSNPVQDNTQNTFQDLLSRVRDEAKRTAAAGYDRARGIYDEGIGLLGKRKQEFQANRDQNSESILNNYEQGRGQLQTSDQGARSRLLSSLRALGLGGSAFVKSEGRQSQDASRALGGLQTERNTNEVANVNNFNANQDWANTQESALSRSLSDAGNARSAAESSADTGYLGDIGNLFNTILSNQLAVKNAVGSYSAPSYTPTSTDMSGALGTGVPNMGSGGVTQDANIINNPALLALQKKRSGVMGAGLYA